jgi:hypothetical protein
MKVVLPLVILTGCFCLFQPNFAQPLHSVSHKIPPYTDYWKYNQNGQPLGIISTTRDSSTTLMFYQFNRNKNNFLESVIVQDVSKTVIYSFSYYYNNASQLVRIEKLADTDYDGKADDPEFEFLFGYDSLNRVVDLKIKKSFTVARHFQFTWKNENIILVENTDGELNYTLKMEFDDLPNPLRAVQWEYITTTGTLEFYATIFCKNNLVKAVLYPAGLDSTELEITPKYNDAGLYISNGMEGVTYHY